ncbi:MAG: hypothetical protein OEZ68_16270 [Gammaproteobacteria bacterium]|nr:hypothetical protein [Gammaproteobacteria bacterium]MDH5802357.1 hypothetical protein [Gammaproteobacteria bacterium]
MDKRLVPQRIGSLILSLFIVWHAVGITVVGPLNKGSARDKLITAYGPYLNLLHLNDEWPFYAPNPFLGSIMSYKAVDRSGQTKTYPLTQAHHKLDHAYFRYTNFYVYLFSAPNYAQQRGYDKSVARFLCAQHQGSVREISFVLQKQKRFTPRDYKAGYRPTDPPFLDTHIFGPFPC